jgi:hypothetical protein
MHGTFWRNFKFMAIYIYLSHTCAFIKYINSGNKNDIRDIFPVLPASCAVLPASWRRITRSRVPASAHHDCIGPIIKCLLYITGSIIRSTRILKAIISLVALRRLVLFMAYFLKNSCIMKKNWLLVLIILFYTFLFQIFGDLTFIIVIKADEGGVRPEPGLDFNRPIVPG